MEEDIDDNFSFGEEEEEETKQIVSYKTLTDFFNQNFEYLPRKFDELLSTTPKLLKLANLMLDLLKSGMDSPLTKDSIEKIELCIRSLLQFNDFNDVAETKMSEKSDNDESDQEKLELMETNEQLQNDLIDMKTKIFSLQHEIKQNQNRISSLKAEIEESATDRARLSKQNLQQKQDFNKELQNQKNQFNDISEKYNDAIAQLKLKSGIEDGLRSQLQMAHAEADGYAKQSEKLSNLLNEKKDKIYKLKIDLKKADIKVSELQTQLSNAQNALQANNSSLASTSQNTSSDNQKTMNQIQLNAKIENLNHQIQLLKDTLKLRETHIESLNKQIQDKDQLLDQSNAKTKEIQDEMDQYKQAVEAGNDKIKKNDEILRSRAVELTQNRDILNKVSELLSASYNVGNLSNIPDIIEDLLSQQTISTVPPQVLSIVDSLTRFISQYLLNDKVDPKILIEPCPTIMNDRKLLNEITKQISEIKETMEQEYGNQFDQYKMFDSLLSAKEHFTEDSSNCEFAALTVLCSANEKLRRLYIAQKKKLEKFNKIFPIESLDEIRRLFNQYSKTSQLYYRQCFDDNNQLLSSFVDNTTDLLSRLRSQVIPSIQKNCEVLELPELVVDTIRELNETLEKEANETSQSFIQQQQDLKETLDNTKNQLETTKFQKNHAEKQNKKLIARVNELSEINKSLQNRLDDALQTRNNLESTYTSVKDLNADQEEKIRSLKLERDKLQDALDHSQKSSQARCDALVAAEREVHNTEMQRTQQMFEEEKKHLTEEMDKREQRYKQQKKKDREMIAFLEKKVKDAQQNISSSSAFASSASSVVNGNAPSESGDDDFVSDLIKELKRCIQVSSWSRQKILTAVRKIVDKLIVSTTDEQWRNWGISVLDLEDKTTKSSVIRKEIEKLVSNAKNTELKNEILLYEKKVLSEFEKQKFNRDNQDYSMAGISRAILFIAIAKKIMTTKMKPRKSYI